MAIEDAVVDAGAVRFRPMALTAAAVVAGSAVIPPVLDLLNAAYGFAPLPGVNLPTPKAPLPAPQATLIATLAQGILGKGLERMLLNNEDAAKVWPDVKKELEKILQ